MSSLEHLDARAAVERQDPRPLAGGHLVHRPDRRAALRQPGHQLDLGAHEHARDAALGRPAGELQGARRWPRSVRRPGTRRCRSLSGAMVRRDVRLTRIAVHDAAAAQSCSASGGRAPSPARQRRRTAANVLLGEGRDQGDDGTALDVLLAAAADRRRRRCRPSADAGRLAQPRHDQVERVGERIAGVDEAQIGGSAAGPPAARCTGHRRDASPAPPLRRPERVSIADDPLQAPS